MIGVVGTGGMRMVLYVDELAALNALVDYCLLAVTAQLGGLLVRRGRLALAALLGGVYAAGMLLFAGAAWMPVRLAVCVGLVGVAFGRRGLARRSVLFAAVSFGFAGVVLLASEASGRTLYSAGVYRISVPLRTLALAAAAGWAVSGILFRGSAKHGLLQRDTCTITLSFCGRETKITALCDTGNELTDPATGLPVLILEPAAAERLLPPELSWLVRELACDNAAALLPRIPGGLRLRFRLVPYRALGRDSGLLLAFRPDEVRGGPPLLAAVSPNRVSNGRYDALIGLIREEQRK